MNISKIIESKKKKGQYDLSLLFYSDNANHFIAIHLITIIHVKNLVII